MSRYRHPPWFRVDSKPPPFTLEVDLSEGNPLSGDLLHVQAFPTEPRLGEAGADRVDRDPLDLRRVVVHLGADLLLRRVYRADQWDHSFVVLDPEGVPRTGEQATNIAGPLCFSGDLLARERRLAPARAGDLLLIRDTGAYTLSMWSRHCSRGLPPSIGFDGNGAALLHAGETAEDVVRYWR